MLKNVTTVFEMIFPYTISLFWMSKRLFARATERQVIRPPCPVFYFCNSYLCFVLKKLNIYPSPRYSLSMPPRPLSPKLKIQGVYAVISLRYTAICHEYFSYIVFRLSAVPKPYKLGVHPGTDGSY